MANPFRSHFFHCPIMAGFLPVISVTLMLACGSAEASLLDDENALGQTIQALRSKIGEHPRVLRIEIEPNVVTIEVQDPANHNHVNQWRCTDQVIGFPLRWVSGPQAVELNLVNPDLEANLFDLDSVALATAKKLGQAAMERARLQDPAKITRMEIERQTDILPKPTCGEVCWTLYITSGRESADVYANAQGAITGADLSRTERAKNLDLFKEPELMTDAAASFRNTVGPSQVLTSVEIDEQNVNFVTNIRDTRLSQSASKFADIAEYSWNLEGLHRLLPTPNDSAILQELNGGPALAPFSINDVDWTIVANLESASIGKVNLSQAQIVRIKLERSSLTPGNPVLAWTVVFRDTNQEETSVVAATNGAIQRVLLPENRETKNTKFSGMEPATISAALAHIATAFDPSTKIQEINFDDDYPWVTIGDPDNGVKLASFELSPDGPSRLPAVNSLHLKVARLSITELASLSEKKIATLESDAMKKLGKGKKVYMDSFKIGANLFSPKADPRADPRVIEIRVRDQPKWSNEEKYGTILYDFDGRVLSLVHTDF